MGVDGFLRQVKEALEESHVRAFSGQTLAVDAFSWLHKACYGCAYELATGKPTDSYVRYMVRKAQLVRTCNVDVVLVFDGQRLPLKAATHGKRKNGKADSLRIGKQLMRDARTLPDEARAATVAKAIQQFQRAVSITQTIVTNVMDALRANGIPFVVAPFEADAQLVWLCKTGAASAIVTEDSDVFLYCMASGVDAPVLFKLDDSGVVQTLSRPSLRRHSEKSSNPFFQKLFHLTTGDTEATRMFVQFCVLSGCDFLDSLPNMGIVTALKHVFNFRGAPAHLRVQRIVSKLASSGVKVPPDFLSRFVQAESVFYHHIVFNTEARACELLIDSSHRNCHRDVLERVLASLGIPHTLGAPSVEPLDLHANATLTSSFLGVVPAPELASGIHNCSINPRTLRSVLEAHVESDAFQPAAASQLLLTSDYDSDAAVTNSPSSLGTVSGAPKLRLRQEAKAPTPEELERRVAGHAKHRSATLKSLLSVYASPSSAVSDLDVATRASLVSPRPSSSTTQDDATSWLLTRVAATPSDSSGSAKKRKLGDDDIVPTSTRSRKPAASVTSFQDLVSRNRTDVATPSQQQNRSSRPTVATASKRQERTSTAASGRSASLAGKRAKSGTGKGTEANGGTLLHFFQRQ